MNSIEDQQLSQSIYAESQRAFLQQVQASFVRKPAAPKASAFQDLILAGQIEVLTNRLNKVDEERRAALEDANRRFAELAEANGAVARLEKRLAGAYGEIAALERKLPPEPPAPPTAGETLAHCKQAIFPQER